MPSSRLLFFSSLLVHILPISSRPQGASPVADASASIVSDFEPIYTTLPASVISAEEARYESATKQFYATAAPTLLAAISAWDAEQASIYADWTADATGTLAPSQSAALASEYAEFTKAEAVWATYNGTGDPFGTTSSTPTTSAYVVPAAAAVAPTGTSWPALPQVKAPAAYGVQCQTVPAPGDTLFVLENCAATIKGVCNHIQMSNDQTSNQYFHDRWYWNRDGGLGCAMGYWFPHELVGTSKVPTQEVCEQTIYGAMTNTCFPDVDGTFNTASVNLKVLPTESETGQQVDSGSLSYIIAAHPPDCDPKFPYVCKSSIFQ